MKKNILYLTAIIFIGIFISGNASAADAPLLEDLMEKGTFPMIFISILGGIIGLVYLYLTGLLPRVLLPIWIWIDERFALYR